MLYCGSRYNLILLNIKKWIKCILGRLLRLISLNNKIISRTQNYKYKLNSLESPLLGETLFKSFVILIFEWSD